MRLVRLVAPFALVAAACSSSAPTGGGVASSVASADAVAPVAAAPPAAAEPAVAQAEVAPSAPAAPADPPLPWDPSVVRGELPNGVRYVVARHANPEGRLSVWLHVHAGSLAEEEDQRGLAHYLEHMAFNGSAHFPPGSVVPFFQSIGLTFGRDQNAYTNYQETTYQLAVPDAREETIDRALVFLSDVATGLTLPPAEIENERQVILEERRARRSGMTRISDVVNERIAPGSTFGRRSPIGTEESIRTVGPAQFRAFYGRWYVPSNMTVLAAGDADPALVVERITRAFGGAASVPRPDPAPTGTQPTRGRRAIVVSDPEVQSSEFSMVRVLAPVAPSLTESAFRREAVEALATRSFARRMQRGSGEVQDEGEGRGGRGGGGGGRQTASVSVRDMPGVLRFVEARGRGRGRDWSARIAEIATHVQRARLHGFTERELSEAKELMLTSAEESVEQAGSRDARTVLRSMNAAVTAGEPYVAPQQRLDLLRRTFETIGVADVSARFAELTDPTDAVFVYRASPRGAPPSEAEVLAAASAAFDARPEPLPEAPRATQLLAAEPAPGTAGEVSEHAATGTASAWLGNGVRVHHREMRENPGQVLVTIVLAAGTIEETAANRGTTYAGALALQRMSAGKLSGNDVRDVLIGRKVHARASVSDDEVTLSIRTTPGDLAEAFRLAHLLLSEPVVERRAFTSWLSGQRQSIASRAYSVQGALSELMGAGLYPEEPRRLALTADALKAVTLDAAQKRIAEIVRTAPAEMSVVGDVPRAVAFDLAARYVGSLPPRERIGPGTLGARRAVKRAAGPVAQAKSIPTRTDRAQVVDGFLVDCPPASDESRRLDLAARVVSTRMVASIREARQLVYSIRASWGPSAVYPSCGTFSAGAPTDPHKAGALGDAITDEFEAFAVSGPTDEELRVARLQASNQFAETVRQPAWWAGVLATMDYRGRDLDRTLGLPAALEAISAADVKDAFVRAFRPEARFRFTVAPRADGAPPPPAAPAPPAGDDDDDDGGR